MRRLRAPLKGSERGKRGLNLVILLNHLQLNFKLYLHLHLHLHLYLHLHLQKLHV